MTDFYSFATYFRQLEIKHFLLKKSRKYSTIP